MWVVNSSSLTFDMHRRSQITGQERDESAIIKCSHSSSQYVHTSFRHNAFVGACLMAYNGHYHLQLSPDDVWIAIMTSLSRYINANAETLRPLFVEHAGQLRLTATGGGSLRTADYEDLITQLAEQIDVNTRSSVREWAEVGFSTTSRLQLIASKVVLMGALQKYFSYGIHLCCGLPKVCVLFICFVRVLLLVQVGSRGPLIYRLVLTMTGNAGWNNRRLALDHGSHCSDWSTR